MHKINDMDMFPAQSHYAGTGWDTFPASLAPLTLLALKVLLNSTWKVICCKKVMLSVVRIF